MKNIGIHKPCSENWNAMSSSEKGAFCQKCATHVHDFTNKTSLEIKQTLRDLIGQPVCARITESQQTTLNLEFEAWHDQSKRTVQRAFVFSLIVVFGLTLFSCSSEQDKQQITQLQATAIQALDQQQVGKMPLVSETSNEQNASSPITAFDSENTGELEYPDCVIYAERSELAPIKQIDNTEYKYTMLGGFEYSPVYIEYLEATEPVQEYDKEGRLIPTAFSSMVFPNPATRETTFELAVPVTNLFEISLFDMNGKFVQSIHSGEIERGTFQQQINLLDLNPGVYLVTIVSKDYKETVRISKI